MISLVGEDAEFSNIFMSFPHILTAMCTWKGVIHNSVWVYICTLCNCRRVPGIQTAMAPLKEYHLCTPIRTMYFNTYPLDLGHDILIINYYSYFVVVHLRHATAVAHT